MEELYQLFKDMYRSFHYKMATWYSSKICYINWYINLDVVICKYMFICLYVLCVNNTKLVHSKKLLKYYFTVETPLLPYGDNNSQ